MTRRATFIWLAALTIAAAAFLSSGLGTARAQKTSLKMLFWTFKLNCDGTQMDPEFL